MQGLAKDFARRMVLGEVEERTDPTTVGYDQYDNPIPDLVFSWTTNVGKMDGVTFTAQNESGVSGFVTATSGAVSGMSMVNITALKPVNEGPSLEMLILVGASLVVIAAIVGIFIMRRRGAA